LAQRGADFPEKAMNVEQADLECADNGGVLVSQHFGIDESKAPSRCVWRRAPNMCCGKAAEVNTYD
jgi:hypothetical protein